ncbi:HAD family hydrolase [Sporofaciens musculi]|uniref:HAD family hydrolase n=1 Tax=Sporofaciens musculi TaxID=2681861 RepID=UPI0025702168|nr:HAD family hydrolase [Sporofaciens musculi]
MGKLIFLDIDGTIRDFDGTVLESGMEAIRKARQNGHEVFLNTGRLYCRIEKKIRDIGFDGVVASSGGYIEYQGERIGHKYFTQLAYIELMKDLLEQDCVVEMGNNKECYVLQENWEDYCRIYTKLCEKLCVDESEALMPRPVESLLEVPDVEQLVVFSRDEVSREILSKWGYSFHITHLCLPYSERWAGEITPNYITKAEAIRQILKMRECGREDTVAIGDGDNDIEMIRFAGTGVAMGNGSPWAKEIADYVTAPIKEDGLWKAFRHLGLV